VASCELIHLENVTCEDLTPVRKRLRVEIPAATVRAELDRAFQTVGQGARLRGFRPGKAPRPVLERVYGEQIRREVLGHLVEESFQQAVTSQGIAIVGTPEIEAETLTAGETLRYSATVDVRPQIAIGDLGGLEATRPSSTVGEADIDRALESMRESAAQLRPIEGRTAVEAGDIVTVDVTSVLDGGEPVHREGLMLEAGTGSFPLALERQLVGQQRGTRQSLTVPYPADYSNPGLAGKTATFEVEIHDLREKRLPPLDDDFARDHGRSESLRDLKERVRVDLEAQAERNAEATVRSALLEQVVARHPFEIPTSLVERRCDALLGGLDLRLPEGVDRDQALAHLRKEVQPRAEHEVRAELILDAIAERENITVTDEEVAAEIEVMSARERQAPERLRAVYDRPEARAALRVKLARERAFEHVQAHAKIMPSA
jgi:trigger factor